MSSPPPLYPSCLLVVSWCGSRALAGVPGAPALWFSCLRGVLPDPDLDTLRSAYPAYYWASLLEVVADFSLWVTTEETDPVTVEEITTAYAWRLGVPALRDALVKDPCLLRKILNGGRNWPPHQGTSKALALFWLCPGPHALRSPPGAPEGQHAR